MIIDQMLVRKSNFVFNEIIPGLIIIKWNLSPGPDGADGGHGAHVLFTANSKVCLLFIVELIPYIIMLVRITFVYLLLLTTFHHLSYTFEIVSS